MTKVFLHGKLGRKFGKEHKFKLRNKKEVISALCGTKKGFKQYLVKITRNGLFYKLVDTDGVCLELKDYDKKPPEEIHIVPTVLGSGPLAAFLSAVGTGIIQAMTTVIGESITNLIVETLINIGVSILIQGLMNMLFGDETEGQIEGPIDTNSYLFNNHANTAVQGFGVPLVYGEVRCGSFTISTNMKNVDISRS